MSNIRCAVRYAVKKSFDEPPVLDTTIVYFGVPIVVKVRSETGAVPTYKNLEIMGLGQEQIEDIDKQEVDEENYIETAQYMFPEINPETNEVDVNGTEFYAKDIADTIRQGILVPQRDADGKNYFNGEGTITIAEVLKAVGIFAADDSIPNKESDDKVSKADDFFNKGYNACCWGYSSPFYNLYRRDELKRPITRIELAYILVICTQKYNLFGLQDGVGVNFDWLHPFTYISSFTDYEYLNVGLIMEEETPILDLRKYLNGRTVTDLLHDIKTGKSAIPLSMLMALVELGVEKCFYFENKELSPLRQVSRGEVCYLFTKLMHR